MASTSNGGGLVADPRAAVTDRKEFLVNNELMSDVVFLVGKAKQKIYAHKQLLVAASDYFYAMFGGKFRESNATEISLEDIEWPILKEILRHIYCGKIDLNSKNVREIFTHSKKFLLPELLGEVSDFLIKGVTPESALQSLSQNRFFEFQEVEDKCLEFIGNDPLQYFSGKNFARIDRDSLEVIVKVNRINCSDWQLLNAVQDWQKANPAENVNRLQAYMKRSARIYRCQKWQLFGGLEEYNADYRDAGLKFIVRTGPSVFINGLGVIARKGKLRIRITSSPAGSVLCDRNYDVNVTETEGMTVMDCFFPKCEIKPETTCKISLSGNSLSKTKSLLNADFLFNQNMDLLPIDDNEYFDMFTNVSCFYCNTGPSI